LGPDGVLVKNIPGFSVREAQVQLASAVSECIENRYALIAEAGTGTGKTFAYLVPCLLSGQKAIISTATKILQDQLFQKDLPTLVRALGLSLRVQNLKGRANYICRYRVALHADEGRFSQIVAAQQFTVVYEKIARLQEGDRTELPEIADDAPVWPYVTSTTDNCLGTECEFYQTCFLVKARRRAMDADLVVINHHLFFADSELKQEGIGELLPDRTVLIFDEAHGLPEIATHFFGEHLGTRQLREWFDDAWQEWPALLDNSVTHPLDAWQKALDEVMLEAFQQLAKLPSEDKISDEHLLKNPGWKFVLQKFLTILEGLLACFRPLDLQDKPGLARCKDRLDEFHVFFKRYCDNASSAEKVQWIDRFKQHIVFHRTPIDVAPMLQTRFSMPEVAYIFTSATLTVLDQFDSFIRDTGLTQAKTLCLPSPFDYKTQTLLYLPRGMPDPKRDTYTESLLASVLPVIQALQGRCFVLFTSHRALKEMAEVLSPLISYPLLIQGTESKPILLERFRSLGNAVLLGTSTFWEGVDVKGEALSCVIIDKLPFSSPQDPVMAGRMAYLKKQGRSSFFEMTLPEAIIALKQGVGRLIRDVSDKGILMIADPRLTGRAYGGTILASLPKMKKTRDEALVLAFIKENLSQSQNTYETIST
jgi:ATP-dependent DNA helicase DinG